MFSIIIPLYNKEEHIAIAVKSVLSQSYQEFELIIINDGSTDGSVVIVKSIIDDRVTLLEQTNQGVSIARNRGIEFSKYEFICFLDADDWWEFNFLANMFDLIKSVPNAGIYASNYFIVKNNQKKKATIGLESNFTKGVINYLQVYVKSLCMPLTSISVVIPKKILKDVGLFSPKLKLGEDFDLWLRIVLKYKVAFINQYLAYYNQDVIQKNRAVGKLHEPESHILWNLRNWEDEEYKNTDLKQLFDNHRVYGLLPYYLTKKYHSLATEELLKVNWENQTFGDRIKYKIPVSILILHFTILKYGSKLKQRVLKFKINN